MNQVLKIFLNAPGKAADGGEDGPTAKWYLGTHGHGEAADTSE